MSGKQPRIPDNDLLTDLRRVARKLDQDWLTCTQYGDKSNGALYSYATIHDRFLSWLNALKRAHLKRTQRTKFPDEALKRRILEDILRVARSEGKGSLTESAYVQSGGKFSPRTIAKAFDKWHKALELAGLKAGKRRRYTNEELLLSLSSLWRTLGRQPTRADFRKGSMIAYATYAHKSHFGKWSNAIHACESYMKTLSLPLGSESGMSREHSASQAPEIATVFALDDIEGKL